MARGRGGGLSIDSDPIGSFFLHTPSTTLLNSYPSSQQHLQPKCKKKKKKKKNMDATVSTKRSSPSTTTTMTPFQVNLSCSHHHESPPKRPLLDEMDFFSHDKDALLLDNLASASASSSLPHHHPTNPDDISQFKVNTGLNLLTTNTSSDQSMVEDDISPNSVDRRAKTELVVLQAELERMKAENHRLRDMLDHVNTNYNALQMHLMNLMQDHKAEEQGQEKKQSGIGLVPRQFMDLGLAINNNNAADAAVAVADEPSLSSSVGRSQERSKSPANNLEVASKEFGNKNSSNIGNNASGSEGVVFDHDKKELGSSSRGIEREDSPSDQGAAAANNNKAPRLSPPSPNKNVDQAEATMRKARVSVRARSEAAMITDGCHWRKYGQKMAKGNPCPRAYYKCTMAAGCPVRKQVQRCAEDRTVLITTYEGNHNHPLPPAAMAMVQTTSSAARMLLSGSMSSADSLMNANFLTRTLLPCSSSMATISASAPFPTVTLDMTNSPNPLQFPKNPSQFQIPFPGFVPQNSFANSPAASFLPQIFGQALYNNQSKFSGLQVSKDVNSSDPSSQLGGNLSQQAPPPQHLADTVTAAIASDPNFTAALAAAITSIIGGAQQNNNNNNNSTTSTNNGNTSATTTNNNNGNVTSSNNITNGGNKINGSNN